MSYLFQGMLMEGPPGPEGPAVSVCFTSQACGRCLGAGGGKEGATDRPLPTPLPGAHLRHPQGSEAEPGCCPVAEPLNSCPDSVFDSRVSQDLRERWAPLGKRVTPEKG